MKTAADFETTNPTIRQKQEIVTISMAVRETIAVVNRLERETIPK